jgi:hypothetical protein
LPGPWERTYAVFSADSSPGLLSYTRWVHDRRETVAESFLIKHVLTERKL